jgi:hypothetical protein
MAGIGWEPFKRLPLTPTLFPRAGRGGWIG